jgi:Outer membrane lipoprotein-sorting protein
MTVLSPKEESEKAMLVFEEEGKPTDAISYLSGLKKTAHLKSDNPLNFRGSKSTVQEMLGLELGKYEITSTELGNGIPDKSFLTINLEQKKGEGIAYPKIAVSYNKNTSGELVPSIFVLSDSQGKTAKKMEITETTKVGNYNSVKVINVSDARNNLNLKLETRSIKYDTNLPSSLFTEAQLIKSVTAATAKLVQ